MSARLADARDAARRRVPESLEELRDLVRIRSVSGSPAHRREVERAAEWLARWLRRRTPVVHLVPGRGGPVVLARVRGAAASSPAVCVYGHLDVRPAGGGWTVAPFAATVRGHRLLARGASDDKGQLMAQLVALDAWTRAGGPPTDVVVVAETGEEVGSPGLAGVLRAWRAHPVLRGPYAAVVVADTRSAGPGRPSLTASQRGSLALRVVVDVGGRAVHAGRFGGAVLDPSFLLAEALLRLRRAVTSWRAGCDVSAALPSDAAVRAAAGVRATPGAGRLADRSARRGAVSVSRWCTRGATGSIPTSAAALVDVRLPPGLRTEVGRPLAVAALRGKTDPGHVRVEVLAQSRGECLRLPPDVRATVRAASLAAYGREPAVLASGGSQPAVTVLSEATRAPVVLLGLGPHDDGAHGPDEYLDLEDWVRAIDACVCLLGGLGRMRKSESSEVPKQPGESQTALSKISIRRRRAETPDWTDVRAVQARPRRLEGVLHG